MTATAPPPSLTDLPAGQRRCLAPLFEDLAWPRPMIEAALEGEVGQVTAGAGEAPAAAALHVQIFTILGGDPGSSAAADLVDTLAGDRFAIGSNAWYDLLRQRRGRGLQSWYWRPYDNSRLDSAHLRRLAASAHAAYEILPLDEELLSHAWPDLDVGLPQHGFRSEADLLERGFGFCAVRKGRVLSAAVTLARSSHSVEVQTNTHRRHQRRGLATSTCAALVLRCLEEGLPPHWSAANHRSEGLAEKLGFIPLPRRQVLYLPR